MIFFNQDVIHDGFGSAANNLANYLLVENGKNNQFETTSCQAGRKGDDVVINFSGVQYNTAKKNGNLSFIATHKLTPAFPVGKYRLFVCGTTSIKNLARIRLNNGTDTIISFSVDRKSP